MNNNKDKRYIDSSIYHLNMAIDCLKNYKTHSTSHTRKILQDLIDHLENLK